jgi:hypothetical protein
LAQPRLSVGLPVSFNLSINSHYFGTGVLRRFNHDPFSGYSSLSQLTFKLSSVEMKPAKEPYRPMVERKPAAGIAVNGRSV